MRRVSQLGSWIFTHFASTIYPSGQQCAQLGKARARGRLSKTYLPAAQASFIYRFGGIAPSPAPSLVPDRAGGCSGCRSGAGAGDHGHQSQRIASVSTIFLAGLVESGERQARPTGSIRARWPWADWQPRRFQLTAGIPGRMMRGQQPVRRRGEATPTCLAHFLFIDAPSSIFSGPAGGCSWADDHRRNMTMDGTWR